ncbi:MAG TPA: YkgJ family cysteine cluster protein [Thermoplasmata archaeon]|nr:YkgJ family cysteine cluster protein [Thermoplasmata archaeon]
MTSAPPIDLSLLSGTSFRCRPGCGLCCFTTPAVEPREAERLIQIEPATPFLEGEGGWRYVADQGEGGACHFLSERKCRAYGDRPFCCQEFPLSVHLGVRAQATVVLSCPGISVRSWVSPASLGEPASAPEGLSEELEAVQQELLRHPAEERLREASRRWRLFKSRLLRTGGWSEPSEIRASLLGSLPSLVRRSFPPPPPPSVSEGIDALPILFDEAVGLVALADHAGGWELLSIEETGQRSRSLGVWPAPSRFPLVSPEGEELLRAYLAHLLDRDFTYWSAAERVRSERSGSLERAVSEDVGRFGALVLARAEGLQGFRSADRGPLSADLVWDGIRATDGEFLDRPTLGWVL